MDDGTDKQHDVEDGQALGLDRFHLADVADELYPDRLADALAALGYLAQHADQRGGFALVARRTGDAGGYVIREGRPITLALGEADLEPGDYSRVPRDLIERAHARLSSSVFEAERRLDERERDPRRVGFLAVSDARKALRAQADFARRHVHTRARLTAARIIRLAPMVAPRARGVRARASRRRASVSRARSPAGRLSDDAEPRPLRRLLAALARLLRGAR
jgi:hypothetical protein